MLSGLRHDEISLFDSDFTPQPCEYATIDHSVPAPRIASYSKPKYTPYANAPVSRLIPRKRYVIMPPRPGIKSQAFPGVHVLKQLKDAPPVYKKVVQDVSTIPRISSHDDGYRMSNQKPSSTKYVLRIPRKELPFQEDSTVKTHFYVPHNEFTKRIHIPTVPASMSMGAEYQTDEDELIDEDNLTVAMPSEMSSYYSQTIRKKFDVERYICSEVDCFWRGPTHAALKKHMVVNHRRVRPEVKTLPVQPVAAPAVATPTTVAKPKGVRCSECDTMAYSRPLLLRHMTKEHGIEAPLIHKTFQSRDQLQEWLEKLRDTHAVEFVVSSGSKKWGHGLQVHYLTCSRSGEQKERPNKKYVRPPRPSIKCGKNCMAYLKIKQNPTTSVLQIEGCLHHSGHEIDPSKIVLEESEWAKIEILVAQKHLIPHLNADNEFNGYLAEIREILDGAGRFRLMSSASLCTHLPKWIQQCHQPSRRQNVSSRPSKMQIEEQKPIVRQPRSMMYSPQIDVVDDSVSDDYEVDDNYDDILTDEMLLEEYGYESDDAMNMDVRP